MNSATVEETKRYGLLGRHLGHSLSPRIHELIFELAGLRGTYDLIEKEPCDVLDFVRSFGESGMAGLNVTIPYKCAVMPALRRISPEARDIGAVNTISAEDGELAGHNTDYYGFLRMLEMAGIPVRGQAALILGTGGSAMAVFCALRDGGAARIAFLSRDPGAAAGRFGGAAVIGYGGLPAAHGYGLLINCTPVGMHPRPAACPLDDARIAGFRYVADLIYNPPETRLLAAARARGAVCANGLAMLAAQAVRSQEIWNGRRLGEGIVGEILRRFHPAPGRNVVLIGMPGSGKTAVGKRLAQACGYDFVDLDEMIESRGRSIADLFAQGEETFREQETLAAREAARRERTVIATGGGIVTRPESMRALSETGTVIFIDRPVGAIDRDIDYAKRPLLRGGKASLLALYRNRLELYRRYADRTVSNSAGIGEAVEAILEFVKES